MGIGKKLTEIDKALDFLYNKLRAARKKNDLQEIKAIEEAIKEQRNKNFKFKKIKNANQWHK